MRACVRGRVGPGGDQAAYKSCTRISCLFRLSMTLSRRSVSTSAAASVAMMMRLANRFLSVWRAMRSAATMIASITLGKD